MYKNCLSKTISVFLILVLFTGTSFTLSTAKIVQEKKGILTTTEIDGLYYLRDDDPLGWADVGSLLRGPPEEDELTQCGMFVNFHFAEPGDYIRTNTISNIYYRFWQQYCADVEYEVGYSTSSEHTAGFDEFLIIDINDYKSEVDGLRLMQIFQNTDPKIAVFNGDEIFNFTIKIFGPNPYVICSPHQSSFVILNLEDNGTLKTYDRDGDGLSDFDELFVYYTNPFDDDTDNDGYSDYDESDAGTDPNDYGNYPQLNKPPNTPIGSGPTSVKPGKSYEYDFELLDPNGDDMFLLVDWGDGIIEEWSGPFESGEIVTIRHTWGGEGTYSVKYKAKDVFYAESGWGTLEVIAPRNKFLVNSLFLNFFKTDFFTEFFRSNPCLNTGNRYVEFSFAFSSILIPALPATH